jgi:hypothetical protein
MDRATVIILGIAGFLAVTSLVRLMTRWRDHRWVQLRDEMQRSRKRKHQTGDTRRKAA